MAVFPEAQHSRLRKRRAKCTKALCLAFVKKVHNSA
jgi:hypothetical protein